jgi:hypothetical protein
MSRLIFLKILAFGLLTGCASNQPLVLNADNPASPLAREAITSAAQPSLSVDAASKRTRALIAARAAEDTQGQHLFKTRTFLFQKIIELRFFLFGAFRVCGAT